MTATPNKLADLAEAVRGAIAAGKAAADASPDDGGSANLDHVVLYGLRGVRETSLRNAGVDASKGRHAGEFTLPTPFGGQGNRRYLGVQAMCKHLKDCGWSAYVYYVMD